MMRLIWMVFVVLCLGMGLVACSSSSGPPLFVRCSKADDCKGLLKCVEGQCRHQFNGTTPTISRVYGTTPCSNRVLKSNSGTQTLRLFLADETNAVTPNALDLDAFQSGSMSLSHDSFRLSPTSSAGSFQVFEADTGDVVPGAAVTLAIDTGTPVSIHPNPHWSALHARLQPQRVPQAAAMLIDMSDVALAQDNGALRTAVPASWVLEFPNTDSSQGSLDILSMFLMRNDALNANDNLFSNWSIEGDRFIPEGGSYQGFVTTTSNSRDRMSEKLISTGNPLSSETAPVYAALESWANLVRSHSQGPSTKLFNPSVIALVLSKDTALVDKNATNHFEKAKQALLGKGWAETGKPETADFIPLQLILWHKPSPPNVPNPPSQQDWDAYEAQLCNLVEQSGGSGQPHFGNLFPIIQRGSRDFYKFNLSDAFKASWLASKGHVSLKVKYSLSGTGIQVGKRYNIAFKVLGKLFGSESPLEDAPLVYITVQAQ